MATYLKIENPSVCPIEGFTILGATSKHLSKANSPFCIGAFGSGIKMSCALLLRNNLAPIVYCSNHKLEFGTRTGRMQALEGNTNYNRIVVKHGGKDESGCFVTYTEELSQTDEYGIIDWNTIGMAMREFVSNAIDAAIAVNGDDAKCPWDGVKIELVPENQVRAKKGYTRVFVPADNEEVIRFFANIGKWFLHFSEPDFINKTILQKRSRNLDVEHKTAVIYRRGVRVREIAAHREESLFDYNINDLRMDESRNVDDYSCLNAAACAMGKSSPAILAQWMQSFRNDKELWEHGFGGYELNHSWGESSESIAVRRANWNKALEIVGDNVVLSVKDGPNSTLIHKGYTPLIVPEAVMRVAEDYQCTVPSKVLSADELSGRKAVPPTQDAINALDWVWNRIDSVGMTNGKKKPPIQCFQKVMDGGNVIHGFYRDGVVYVNEDFASGTGVDLRQTILEEVAHYITNSKDETRDMQDWAFKFAVRMGERD